MALRAPTSTRPVSLSDDVYRRLRDEIVKGRIRPNERLVEVELAERLGVSRTPIRDSLKLLASEGLIVGGRHRLVVRDHAPHEIREIYEARAALEGYAARLAAERATPDDIARIAGMHDIPTIVGSPRDHLVEVNNQFHDAIVETARNRRLGELIRSNRDYYFNYRIAEEYSDAEARESLEGHTAVLRAIRAHDADAAEREVRAHVLVALDLILAKLSPAHR